MSMKENTNPVSNCYAISDSGEISKNRLDGDKLSAGLFIIGIPGHDKLYNECPIK